MPTPESSLSVAMQATADLVASRMSDDVVVTVDAPQRAQKQAEDANTHVLNLFVYRIIPSGFHPDMGHEAASFIRASILITAFPAGQGDLPPDSDLRVLGQAIRILQSFPVLPMSLPGAAPAGAPAEDFRRGQFTQYRLQVVMQAPTMEELNHIWTTQGGELAYRLSVVYELALIPIEPLSHAQESPLVQEGSFEVVSSSARGPFQMFVSGGRLFSQLEVPAGVASVTIGLTGEPNTLVSVVVEWRRAGGAVERQAMQEFTIQTSDLEAADARFEVLLESAAVGDTATFSTTIVDDASLQAGNLITLSIGV